MTPVSSRRVALLFAVVLGLLATLQGNAFAAEGLPSCCVERVATGEPMILDHAFQAQPRAPALNLSVKITVTVEVRRVITHRSGLPAADTRAGTDAHEQTVATK